MKWNWIVAILAVPMLAYADHGPYGAWGAGCLSHGCELGGLGLLGMAGVSALGYWVLRHAVKDQGWVRRAGEVVGWALLVGGLLGFILGGYVKLRSLCPSKSASCPISGQTS